MKRALTLIVLAMFSVSLTACHASVDTDDTNGGSHYKKTTTTTGDGTKTTTEKKTTSTY